MIVRNFGRLAAPALALTLALGVAACGGGNDSEGGAEKGAGGPPPAPPPLTMAARPDATGGEALYVEKCGMCHGPGGMGTGLLARRVDVALLEDRTDLTPDFVISAARMGIGNMPAIPRGEVSDDQMQQIAEYLSDGEGAVEQPAAEEAL